MSKDYVRNIEGKDFDFLIGKSIIKVIGGVKVDNGYDKSDGYILICNDGTEIRVALNEGCGGCGNGWSEIDLSVLENNKNVITNVEYKKGNDSEGFEYDDDAFTLFIYYEDNKINRVDGSDGYGNGYYGGGFYLSILEPEKILKGEDNE